MYTGHTMLTARTGHTAAAEDSRTSPPEGRLKQMGKKTIAVAAAALLGLGVIGVGAARVGGYLSNSVSPGTTVSQTTARPAAGGSVATPAGGVSVPGSPSQTGDGAGPAGD
jgi:hypothetical protein